MLRLLSLVHLLWGNDVSNSPKKALDPISNLGYIWSAPRELRPEGTLPPEWVGPARQTDTVRQEGGVSDGRGADSSAGLPGHLRGLDHPAEREAALRCCLRTEGLAAEGP